LEHLPPG
jgi:hypothetical protein